MGWSMHDTFWPVKDWLRWYMFYSNWCTQLLTLWCSIIYQGCFLLQLEKYKNYDFGRCPRVYCCGQPCLPVGQSDIHRSSTVKIYCPKCEDIYYPRSKYQGSILTILLPDCLSAYVFQTLTSSWEPKPTLFLYQVWHWEWAANVLICVCTYSPTALCRLEQKTVEHENCPQCPPITMCFQLP